MPSGRNGASTFRCISNSFSTTSLVVISWDPWWTLTSSLMGGQHSPWGSKHCQWWNKLLSVPASQAWYILKCHWQFYCQLACLWWFQWCWQTLILLVFFCTDARDGMIPSFPIRPWCSLQSGFRGWWRAF
jgi:hypothetical protein